MNEPFITCKALLTKGTLAVVQERNRQITEEHWSTDHDSLHSEGSLARAAACYACPELSLPWPVSLGNDWDKRKKHSRIHQLEIAGALIAAELDRLLEVKAIEQSWINEKVHLRSGGAIMLVTQITTDYKAVCIWPIDEPTSKKAFPLADLIRLSECEHCEDEDSGCDECSLHDDACDKVVDGCAHIDEQLSECAEAGNCKTCDNVCAGAAPAAYREFRVGNTVKLRSGGPTMTVVQGPHKAEGGSEMPVTCTWYESAQSDFMTREFLCETLEECYEGR